MAQMVTIDPAEMAEVAQLLRSCAMEAADIGAGLSSCTQCVLPAEIRALVDQLGPAADRVCEGVAIRLLTEAVELVNRAIVAAGNPVAAITGAALPAGSPTVGFGANMIGGSGWSFTSSGSNVGFGAGLIGGTSMAVSASSPMVSGMAMVGGVSVPVNAPAPVGFGPMVGGGNSWYPSTSSIGYGNLVGGGNSWSPSTSSIGYGNLVGGITSGNSSGPGGGFSLNGALGQLAARKAEANQAELNRLARVTSGAEFGQVIELQDRQADGLRHVLAPTRSDLERDAGHTLTISEIAAISPFTLPRALRPVG